MWIIMSVCTEQVENEKVEEGLVFFGPDDLNDGWGESLRFVPVKAENSVWIHLSIYLLHF